MGRMSALQGEWRSLKQLAELYNNQKKQYVDRRKELETNIRDADRALKELQKNLHEELKAVETRQKQIEDEMKDAKNANAGILDEIKNGCNAHNDVDEIKKT